MKVATWNVNSVRVRKDQLLGWLDAQKPDVLCLQELKCQTPDFPYADVGDLGYEAAVFGQKTYNGVALLSPHPIEDIQRGFGDGEPDDEARIVSGLVAGVRVVSVYVPNGATVGSAKWASKRAFFKRLAQKLAPWANDPLLVLGDFNVAPEERDVAKPAAWEGSVLTHPDARADLAQLTALGLVDTFRSKVSEGGHYSWWDYRQAGFKRNDGLRIDLVLASPALAARCQEVFIDREARAAEGASDHTPVGAVFVP